MPKVRKRKKAAPPAIDREDALGPFKLKRVQVPTLELVQITSVEQIETAEVEGRLVKLCPAVRASEKAGYDGPLYVARLRERGARAVVHAPRIISDVHQRQVQKIKSLSSRELVAEWFNSQRGVPAMVRTKAHELVLDGMEKEGL